MKIIHGKYSAHAQVVSISAAITGSLVEDDGGIAECAQRSADNCAKAIGVIMERLHARGIVEDGDIVALLSYRYDAVGDDG